MSNSKINLSDLKESNINQLVATEMFMIRGGCGRRRQSRSNKCGSFTRGSYSKKGRIGGCNTGINNSKPKDTITDTSGNVLASA